MRKTDEQEGWLAVAVSRRSSVFADGSLRPIRHDDPSIASPRSPDAVKRVERSADIAHRGRLVLDCQYGHPSYST
jgi:hypothetical protein